MLHSDTLFNLHYFTLCIVAAFYRNLYFTDRAEGVIGVTNMNGNYRRNILTRPSQFYPADIVLSPTKGYVSNSHILITLYFIVSYLDILKHDILFSLKVHAYNISLNEPVWTLVFLFVLLHLFLCSKYGNI